MKIEQGKRGPGRPPKEKRTDQLRLYIDHEVLKAWRIMCLQREIDQPDALEEALREQMKNNPLPELRTGRDGSIGSDNQPPE